MAFLIFIEAVIPPLIFVLIYKYYKNIKWAVLGAIASGTLFIAITYLQKGFVDRVLIADVGLVVFFGWLSTVREDPIWFKLQPSAMAIALLLMGVYLHFAYGGAATFFKDYLELHLQDYPEQLAQFRNPVMLKMLNLVFLLAFAVAVPIHGVINAFAAYRWSDKWWLVHRAVGIYPLLLICVVAGAVITRISI